MSIFPIRGIIISNRRGKRTESTTPVKGMSAAEQARENGFRIVCPRLFFSIPSIPAGGAAYSFPRAALWRGMHSTRKGKLPGSGGGKEVDFMKLGKPVFFCDSMGVLSPETARRSRCRPAEVIPAGGVRRFTGDAADLLAALDAKIDKLSGLMASQVFKDNARRRSRHLEPPMTSSECPSVDQMAARWRKQQAATLEKRCAEQKAAYDAMNPHKKDRGAV